MIWFGVLIGLFVGSFLNVVIDRGLSGRSVVFPPSACEGCGGRLRPWELIPVVSWVALRGRCVRCGARLGVQYPAVELLTGALGALVMWVTDGNLAVFVGLFSLLAALLAAAVTDLRSFRLPDRLVLGAGTVTGALLLGGVWLTGMPGRVEEALLAGLMFAGGVALLDTLGSGLQRLLRPRQHSSVADYPLATLALAGGAWLTPSLPVAAGVAVAVFALGWILTRLPLHDRLARVLARLELPALLVTAAGLGYAWMQGDPAAAFKSSLVLYGAALMALAFLWAPLLLDGARRARLAHLDSLPVSDPVAVGFGDVKFAFYLGLALGAAHGLTGLWGAALWLIPVSAVLSAILSVLRVKKLPFGPVLFTAAVMGLWLPQVPLSLLGY